MNIRKIIPIVIVIAAACFALTACMNSGDTGVQTTPSATADFNPGATTGTGVNNGNGTAGSTGMDGMNGNSGNGNTGMTGNTGATGDAGNTASSSTGALGTFDWANGAAGIERAIGQISEISDSRVVVTNSTALVGVKFDSVYKGQLTERIREMVAAEVLKADPSIQTVAVTSDAEDVQKVYALSDQIRAGRTADELSSDINAIVRNATTLR